MYLQIYSGIFSEKTWHISLKLEVGEIFEGALFLPESASPLFKLCKLSVTCETHDCETGEAAYTV